MLDVSLELLELRERHCELLLVVLFEDVGSAYG